MRWTRLARGLRAFTATVLAAVLFALSPGLEPYAAAQAVVGAASEGGRASVFSGLPGSNAASGVPRIPSAAMLAPTLEFSQAKVAAAAPVPNITGSLALPAAAVLRSNAPIAAAGNKSLLISAPTSAKPAASPPIAPANFSLVRKSLPLAKPAGFFGLSRLWASTDAEDKPGLLERIFTGARDRLGLGSGNSSVAAETSPAASLSAASALQPHSQGASSAALAPPSPVVQISAGLNPFSVAL